MTVLKYYEGGVWKPLPMGGPSSVLIEDWKTVGSDGLTTFSNNWANYGGSYPAQYRKRPDGIVEMRGLIRSGTLNTIAFYLPAGYKPNIAAEHYFPASSAGSAESNVFVQADGRVQPQNGSNSWFSLDNIRFSTDQTTFPTGPKGEKGDKGDAPVSESYLVVSRPDQSITSGVEIGVVYNNVISTRGAAPPTLNTGTGVVTIQEAGYYAITAYGYFNDVANNNRRILQLYAGGNRIARASPNPSGTNNNNPGDTLATTVYVGAGTTITATIYHDCGAGILWQAPQLFIAKVGPGAKGDKGDPGGNSTVPMDPFHTVGAAGEPAFGSGWGALSGKTVTFRKDPLGKVMIRGALRSTAAWDFVSLNNRLFTLPAGYWPATDLWIKAFTLEPSGANASGVQVGLGISAADGSVKLAQIGASPTGASGTYLWIDEVDFDTGTVTQMPSGPQGAKGEIGYDTAPLGSVITTTRSTWTEEYVLANGQTLTEAAYPDCALVAAAEVVAGNPLWSISGVAPSRTFTVPDLRDRFLYGSGVRPRGEKGGAETHTLTEAQIPSHYHAAAYNDSQGGQVAVGGGGIWVSAHKSPYYITGNTGGGLAHNNLPPYCVLAFLVKVKGVAVSGGVLQGARGEAGSAIPMDPWHVVGAAGEPAPLNGWTHYGAGYPSIQFRKDPLGKVQIRGVAKSGTLGQAIFQLPVGYRPATHCSFMNYTTATAYAAFYIGTDGFVNCNYRNDWADLSVIEFDTDTVTMFPTGPKGDKGDSGTWTQRGVKVRRTTALTVTSAEPVIPWDTEIWDYGDYWTASAPTRLTVPAGEAGVYLVTAGAYFGGSGGSGVKSLRIYKNGVAFHIHDPLSAPGSQGAEVSATIDLAVGDYIEIKAYVAAGAFTIGGSAPYDGAVELTKLGGPQGPKGETGGNATVAMEAWHTVGGAGEPAFGAGYSSSGSPLLAFRKDPLGKVQMRGVVNGINAGTIFTLPVGYRPPAGYNRWVCNDVSGATAFVQVYVDASNGAVNKLASGGGVDLSVVEFDTDTVTAMPTGPQGPQGIQGVAGATGAARTWRTQSAVIKSSSTASWLEIDSSLRISFTPVSGRFYTFTFTSQWEQSNVGGIWMACIWDVISNNNVGASLWQWRATSAGWNITNTYVATMPAINLSATLAPVTLSPYWYCGSGGTNSLRADIQPATFSITETASAT